MQVRVFSPRRKPITTEVGAGETFGGIRTRLGKELGIAGERGLILHRGETVPTPSRAREPPARPLHVPCNQRALRCASTSGLLFHAFSFHARFATDRRSRKESHCVLSAGEG